MRRFILAVGIALSVLLVNGCQLGSGNAGGGDGGGGNGGGGGGGNVTGSITSVKHIVVLYQENRSFDHYFGHLNSYRASKGLAQDVDGTPADASNPCRPGDNCGFDGSTTLSAYHLITKCVENPSPSWNESHVDWNLNHPTSSTPTLDGFVHSAGGHAINEGFNDTMGRRAMGYYTHDDLPYYYFMATQFATSDRFFSSMLADTPPNRMFGYAATSQGHTRPIATGGAQLTAKTIFAALDGAGVSWRIYTNNTVSYLSMFTYGSSHRDHIHPISQYFDDVNNGNLPDVAFIEPAPGTDEHPPTNITNGAHTAASYVNALMNSSSWKDSVFFLTYDEGGGFYDHVPPMSVPSPDGIPPQDLKPTDICNLGETDRFTCDFTVSGFRVPLLVISPFTKPHFVSHTPMDQTAILRFIEKRYNLQPLTSRDAAMPDMTEFFDFGHSPNLNPPSPPDMPSSGPCYLNRLP